MMTVYEFGKALLDEHDLDPLYAMIHGAKISREERDKYTLAYLLFYHTGVASVLTSSAGFWAKAALLAGTATHPRGNDRRHFRPPESTRIVSGLIARHDDATGFLDYCKGKGLSSLRETMRAVERHRGFGITISFKAADMLEQLHGMRYVFLDTDPNLMSAAPRQGADMVAESEGVKTGRGIKGIAVYAHTRIIEEIGDVLVPPLFKRKMSVMETETILCKYSHYRKEKYFVGKGKESQRAGLELYRGDGIVEKMIASGKRQGLWKK